MEIGLIIAGVVFLYIIFVYNSLVSKKNKVEYAFSSIDANLKKRRDLIPNLVAAVKQYMGHERGLLTEITQLRNEVMKEGISDEDRFQVESKLTSMLGQVRVVVENYPDLKASQNFLQLQGAMNEVEEQISASRRAFNASVMGFNNGVEQFPSNIIANMINYKRRASFEIAPVERENVNIADLF